jgi:hypothetical protein
MDSQLIEELLGYAELSVGKVISVEKTLHIYCHSGLERGFNTDLAQGVEIVSKRERQIHELPILNYRVVLHVTVRKYKTSDGSYYWEALSFVRPHSHYTKRYEDHLYTQCKGSDVIRVSRLTGIVSDTLHGIFHYYAPKNLMA